MFHDEITNIPGDSKRDKVCKGPDEFFQTDNDDDTRDHSLETSPEEKNVSKNMLQSRSRGSLQRSCRKSVEIWSGPQLMH